MKKYLENFLNEFNYEDDAKQSLINDFDKIYSNENALELYKQALALYDKDRLCNYGDILKLSKDASEIADIHQYASDLLIIIFMAKRLKEYYKELGLTEEMYYVTVCDLKYKAVECKLIKGVWGSFVGAWFAGFFQVERFGIDNLQFEVIKCGLTCNYNGIEITPETKVINLHIPRTGGRLDKNAMDETLKKAQAFLVERYNLKTPIFYAHSWLLHYNIIPAFKEGSNLKAFADRFMMVSYGDYDSYEQVWRLFDMDYTEDYSKFPSDSSFRRYVIKLMQDKKAFGYGVGVFMI